MNKNYIYKSILATIAVGLLSVGSVIADTVDTAISADNLWSNKNTFS